MKRDDDPLFLTTRDRVLRGQRRVVVGPLPVAGAELVLSVPGGRQWRLIGGRITFVTSAVVANRSVNLAPAGPNGIIDMTGAQAVQAASTTVVYQLSQSNPAGTAYAPAGVVILPFTPILLNGGDSIQTVTTLRDVGDQFTVCNLYVEEFYFDNAGITNDELEERAEVRAALAAQAA
jgi:hypothetical protein